MIFFLDLFAGAGGVSEGIIRGGGKIIACVNHDRNAIRSHALNHRNVLHIVEDVRLLNLRVLVMRVKTLRRKYPGCKIVLWASLECTNFSNAKGGKAKDADSRTLAMDVLRYIDELQPDMFWVENVAEFMTWGPLDEDGRPIKEREGEYYEKWLTELLDRGFTYENQLLTCADYGAPTIRKRLFIQFAKHGIPITWPVKTHESAQIPAVNIIDRSNVGKSIFNRKKPLSTKSVKRIYIGVTRYGHEGEFICTYNGSGKVVASVNRPTPTVTTVERLSYVKLTSGECRLRITSEMCYWTIRLITWMRENNVADISYRMFVIPELLRAQGFPDTYKLYGSKRECVKFIGNAVPPNVVEALTRDTITKLKLAYEK